MKLQLSYELDAGLLLEGLKAIHSRRLSLIRIYSVLQVFGGVLLLIAGPKVWSVAAWVLVACGPLTWAATEFQWRRVARKQLKAFKGAIQAVVDDEFLRQELPSMKSEIKWSAITAVRRTPRLWLLMLSPVQAIYLPRPAFGAEVAAEFETFLSQRGLFRG